MNNKDWSMIILSESATLQDAMLSFEKSALQVVLVCDLESHLIGIATEGDVRRALLNGHGLAAQLLPFVNRKPIVGRTTMSSAEMLSLLSEKIRFVPVLDEQDIVKDILFFDTRTMIPIATPLIGERELRYVTDAILSGWISSRGKYINQFEEQFATFCDSKYAVAVSNGTVALHLALTVLGIGPGDEVIVPALTFVATASAVCHCNATPVFVDVDRGNWNIDPDQIEKAITSHTKAIIPVHLYGQPCDMDRIMEIAEQHNLWVVEDAAEAHGALYQGRPVGSIGHMGCFSFYGNKIITTGEGGMVVTNNSELNKKLRVFRDHGMNPERRYWHDVVGFNYRMTNLQAAIGVAQLERWEQIIEAKDRIQNIYDEQIDFTRFEKAKALAESRPVCWLYTLLLKHASGQVERDAFLALLKSHNVDSRPVFYPIPAMPPYYSENWREKFPVTLWISERGFSLPSSVDLDEKATLSIAERLNELVVLCRTLC